MPPPFLFTFLIKITSFSLHFNFPLKKKGPNFHFKFINLLLCFQHTQKKGALLVLFYLFIYFYVLDFPKIQKVPPLILAILKPFFFFFKHNYTLLLFSIYLFIYFAFSSVTVLNQRTADQEEHRRFPISFVKASNSWILNCSFIFKILVVGR